MYFLFLYSIQISNQLGKIMSLNVRAIVSDKQIEEIVSVMFFCVSVVQQVTHWNTFDTKEEDLTMNIIASVVSVL